MCWADFISFKGVERGGAGIFGVKANWKGRVQALVSYNLPKQPAGWNSARKLTSGKDDCMKEAWLIFTPAERRKALGMLVLVILMAGAETLGVVSIMPFLSVLGRPEVVQENEALLAVYEYFEFEGVRDFLIALGLASILLVVGSSAFKIVTQHLLNRFVSMQRHSLSSRLLSRYLHQPYEFFLSRNPAILSKNVLSEVDQLMVDLVQPLSKLIAQGAVVLAMVLLVLFYDPLMAVCIVAVVGLLYGVIYGVVRRRLGRIGSERRDSNGARFQACNEALGGIKDVKVTHSASAYLQKFNHASRTFSRHTAANETLNQSPLYLVESVGYGGLIVVALVLLARSNDTAQVLPALGLYGFAAYRMLPSAQIMYRGFARLKFVSASLNAILSDLGLPQEGPVRPSEPLSLKREIRLQDIQYAYPASPSKPVLQNFNLVIEVNTSVGIVGRSGAGKSTLMDILLGLLEPQVGTMMVDGAPITAENVTAWQRSIGYVPQHIYLADASVKENIAFGVPREQIDMTAVERAARAAQIHEFVLNELPQEYDTTVGDRGIRLSGGQRQRVGIARALYRDPSVLLLDEATSALDSETETAFNEALKALAGKMTMVVISHKEASLNSCHTVVSLGPTSTSGDSRPRESKLGMNELGLQRGS